MCRRSLSTEPLLSQVPQSAGRLRSSEEQRSAQERGTTCKQIKKNWDSFISETKTLINALTAFQTISSQKIWSPLCPDKKLLTTCWRSKRLFYTKTGAKINVDQQFYQRTGGSSLFQNLYVSFLSWDHSLSKKWACVFVDNRTISSVLRWRVRPRLARHWTAGGFSWVKAVRYDKGISYDAALYFR